MREGKLWRTLCAVTVLVWTITCCQNKLLAQNINNSNEWIELEEKRTAYSKLFTNNKGQFQLKQSAGDLHYLNEYGAWEDIQREVSAINPFIDQYGITRSQLPIVVNTSSGASHVTLSESGEQVVLSESKLEFKDVNGNIIQQLSASAGNSEVNNNKIKLNDYFQSIDRVQWMDYWFLQTDYVLNQAIEIPAHANTVIFKEMVSLPDGWQIMPSEGEYTSLGWYGALWIVNAQGDKMADLSQPIYYDSSQPIDGNDKNEKHATLGQYLINKLDDGYELSLVIEADWLRNPGLVYPVTIDPTINNSYASTHGIQDYISQFNANCQANLLVNLPAGNAISVTNSSFQYTIRAKGLIATYGWDEYFAAGEEQRSRIGCGSNWTGTQYGYGGSYLAQNIAYNISNSNIANGCYSGGTVLTYKWQAYQTFFPTYWGPYITTLSGCQTTYHELLANTWTVTVTYTTANITASASPQTLSICSGQPAVIQLTGTPNNASFSWTASNNGTTGAQNGNGSVINQVLNTTTNGTATYTITPSANGCQGSPITVNVNVSSPVQTTVNAQICAAGTYSFNGTTYNQPGSYPVTLTGSNGCDSTVTLHLTTVSSVVTNIYENICNGNSYNIGNQTYSQPGSYSVTLQSASGCDSIVNLQLAVLPVYQSSFDQWICSGANYSFGGTLYSTSGAYTHVFTAQNGCDSVVTLNLHLYPPTVTNVPIVICSGSSYTFHGNTYNTLGNYPVTLQNQLGCDSVVTLNLQFYPQAAPTIIPVEICSGSSYTFYGNTYNSPGSYPVTLQNQYGCDSIVTLQLTLSAALASTTQHQMCDGESYEFNQTTYTSQGNYLAAFQTLQGCDSIAHLQLTVHPRFNIYLNDGFCPYETYEYMGNTYTDPGTYQINLLSSKGCDSTVHLNLTIHPKPLVDIGDEYNLCLGQNIQLQNLGTAGNYLWSNGSTDSRQTVSTSGIYWLKVTSPAGCEAIDSCRVIVRPLPQSPDSLLHELCAGEMIMLSAGNPGSTYNWSHTNQRSQIISIISPGMYSVNVTNTFGCSRKSTFHVRENCESAIYVPSAFTPDNDGINDYFKVVGENIARFEMRVYNRWGEEVFFSDNPNIGWNGSVMGGDYFAPDGLYHWTIKYRFADENGTPMSDWKQLRGVVNLLR
jgi:gliding motility-associated-like protein